MKVEISFGIGIHLITFRWKTLIIMVTHGWMVIFTWNMIGLIQTHYGLMKVRVPFICRAGIYQEFPKIDYPSGELLFNITLPPPYIANGASYLGNNLLFNFQHHIVKLENGNYTLFDNGNISNQLFEHGYRISRGIEFEILEDSTCNIVWEYSLPPALYGHACGSMQVLENNNRLIFTRKELGANPDRPAILEVTYDKEIVWEMREISITAGTEHFEFLPHPDAFSLMASPYSYISLDGVDMNGVVIDSSGTVTISIKNESDYRQPYQYIVTDNQKWIPIMTGIDTIDAQEQIDIQLDYNFSHGGRYTPYSQINVVVTPVKTSLREKAKGIYHI